MRRGVASGARRNRGETDVLVLSLVLATDVMGKGATDLRGPWSLKHRVRLVSGIGDGMDKEGMCMHRVTGGQARLECLL